MSSLFAGCAIWRRGRFRGGCPYSASASSSGSLPIRGSSTLPRPSSRPGERSRVCWKAPRCGSSIPASAIHPCSARRSRPDTRAGISPSTRRSPRCVGSAGRPDSSPWIGISPDSQGSRFSRRTRTPRNRGDRTAGDWPVEPCNQPCALWHLYRARHRRPISDNPPESRPAPRDRPVRRPPPPIVARVLQQGTGQRYSG